MSLLARYAEASFWLARYMERAENLARLIDVNETFARDARGARNWKSVVNLYADGDAFFAKHDDATARAVLQFYLLDRDNPNSVIASIRAARENARTLRPLISTEMWTQMNVFYNRVQALTDADIALPKVSRLCSEIKEACQAHAGIVEGTFFRDEGWFIYHIGKYLERADQTTRLLDIKYHTLLPSVADVGSPLDISQWNALLRSAAGYHAFRRTHSRGLRPTDVAGFLVFNDQFPRSIATCLRHVATLLERLRRRYELSGGGQAATRLDQVHDVLSERSIDDLVATGLHEFLDQLQSLISSIAGDLGQDFFGYQYD